VRGFGLIEPERSANCIEDVVGHAPYPSALNLDVVLDTDPSQQSYFLTAQALHAATSSVDGKTGPKCSTG
jgi:hypothetical protein